MYDELGGGFLESVYENTRMVVFKEKGIPAIRQQALSVSFHGETIGDFRADIIVDNKVLIELKAASQLHKKHEAQLINYLKVAGVKVGLLVNFGEKLEFRRRVY